MNHNCLEHIFAALELADEMIRMADQLEPKCDDDGCLIVYGVIKDCAYKIKGATERELQAVKKSNGLH